MSHISCWCVCVCGGKAGCVSFGCRCVGVRLCVRLGGCVCVRGASACVRMGGCVWVCVQPKNFPWPSLSLCKVLCAWETKQNTLSHNRHIGCSLWVNSAEPTTMILLNFRFPHFWECNLSVVPAWSFCPQTPVSSDLRDTALSMRQKQPSTRRSAVAKRTSERRTTVWWRGLNPQGEARPYLWWIDKGCENESQYEHERWLLHRPQTIGESYASLKCIQQIQVSQSLERPELSFLETKCRSEVDPEALSPPLTPSKTCFSSKVTFRVSPCFCHNQAMGAPQSDLCLVAKTASLWPWQTQISFDVAPLLLLRCVYEMDKSFNRPSGPEVVLHGPAASILRGINSLGAGALDSQGRIQGGTAPAITPLPEPLQGAIRSPLSTLDPLRTLQRRALCFLSEWNASTSNFYVRTSRSDVSRADVKTRVCIMKMSAPECAVQQIQGWEHLAAPRRRLDRDWCPSREGRIDRLHSLLLSLSSALSLSESSATLLAQFRLGYDPQEKSGSVLRVACTHGQRHPMGAHLSQPGPQLTVTSEWTRVTLETQNCTEGADTPPPIGRSDGSPHAVTAPSSGSLQCIFNGCRHTPQDGAH